MLTTDRHGGSQATSSPALAEGRAPRVVAIGGGTGLPTVLRALRHAADTLGWAGQTDNVTAIVTVMDDGGSSGQLRKAMGILPPGDIRNCLAALVRTPSVLSGILHDRLDGDTAYSGHPIGNLLLAALSRSEGDFFRAVKILAAQIECLWPRAPGDAGERPSHRRLSRRPGCLRRDGNRRPSRSHSTTEVRAAGSTASGCSRGHRQCRPHSGRAGESLYEHSAEPPRRRYRGDALGGASTARVRREPDDRAWRDGRFLAPGSSAGHPGTYRLRSIRLHPHQSQHHSGVCTRGVRVRRRSCCRGRGRRRERGPCKDRRRRSRNNHCCGPDST